ncbi:unnamed protein product, partial [marine sediment metagenome]
KGAILLSSFFFAAFHFSILQKWSNVTILVTLFVLSIFLGLLYERQKSLLSPIVLHSTFNFFSVLNLLFLEGALK